MTPEGKIKSKIKKVLDKYKGRIYAFMPVPSGYGMTTVDYIGCFRGHFFVIEAKREGKWPTTKQDQVLADVRAAGGKTFVINDDASLEVFATWLESVEHWNREAQELVDHEPHS